MKKYYENELAKDARALEFAFYGCFYALQSAASILESNASIERKIDVFTHLESDVEALKDLISSYRYQKERLEEYIASHAAEIANEAREESVDSLIDDVEGTVGEVEI